MASTDDIKLTGADIKAILDLIEALSGNPALSNRDRILLGALAIEIDDRAAKLADKSLNRQNPAIRALIKKFNTRATDLIQAHDNLIAATNTINTFAKGITAFTKLIGLIAPKNS